MNAKEHERVQVRLVEVDGFAYGEVVDGWLRGERGPRLFGMGSSVVEIRLLEGEEASSARARFNAALDSLPTEPKWDEGGVHLIDEAVRNALAKRTEK